MLAETPSSFFAFLSLFFPGYLFAFRWRQQGAWGWFFPPLQSRNSVWACGLAALGQLAPSNPDFSFPGSGLEHSRQIRPRVLHVAIAK